ncbi:MAG: glycosyltransferase [Actinomycetota bacterium]|nr:glycosyltransferase [Actinomycetota bacterium]
MTRVLQVLGRSTGGIARHVAQVVDALDGEGGLTIDIAGPGEVPIAMPKALLPLDIPHGPVRGHLRAIHHVRQLAAGYDVVHAHGLRAGTDVGIATRGCRKLVTIHNLVRPQLAGGLRGPLYNRIESLTVALNDRVFTVSDDMARRLRRAWPSASRKIEVLHLGVGDAPTVTRTAAEVRIELGAGGRPLVVTVARLVAQKDLGTLLAALERLPGAVLAIVGEGPDRAGLHGRMRELAVTDRVHLMGFRPDATDFIAAADVFCLSSIWEGVPLAAQEAILLGVPVVATDVGGMRELIANKISGRLVPPRDPAALAAALSEVIVSEKDRKRYVGTARRHLEEEFSTERMLDTLRTAYAT